MNGIKLIWIPEKAWSVLLIDESTIFLLVNDAKKVQFTIENICPSMDLAL